MSILGRLGSSWRKNGPELAGLFNGALPRFVAAARPDDRLDGIPVFCYHLVEGEDFDADLVYLGRNGYRTVRGQDLARFVRGEWRPPERAVVLTFDDGPRNFFDVAYPLLAKHSAFATAFIAPGLHADAGPRDDLQDRPMTWSEIETIHRSGLVEFQSHTLESRFVPRWPEPVPLAGCAPDVEGARRGAAFTLVDDLTRSREMIEARLPGATVDQLAFPAYLGTDEGVAAARSAGIRACYWGLAAGRDLSRPGDSPYHITRLSGEFLRRLPGVGRISVAELLRGRVRRAGAARDWRRRHSGTGAT